MPNANYRVTVFLESQDQGWTENFYRVTAERGELFRSAKNYIEERRKILSRFSYVTHFRISDADVIRDADFFTYAGESGRGLGPATNPASTGDEITNAAVNLRLFAGPTKWRNLLLRGLPQDAIRVNSEGSFVSSQFQEAVAKLVLKIRAEGFSIQTKVVGAESLITATTFLNSRLTHITTQPNILGLNTNNQRIRIRLSSGVANLDGVYRVVRVEAAPTYRVYSKQKKQQGTYLADSGLAGLLTYEYVAITDGVVVGATTRRTGRPSYKPRGRRSVQRA